MEGGTRQDAIEQKLAARHLREDAKPSEGIDLFIDRGIGHRAAADTVEAVAPGDMVRLDFLERPVFAVAHQRARSVQPLHALHRRLELLDLVEGVMELAHEKLGERIQERRAQVLAPGRPCVLKVGVLMLEFG